MELQLYASKTVKEVKKAFQQAFPYLKLEFFYTPHQQGEGSYINKKVDNNTYLIDITGVLREGIFTVSPETTVYVFESQLQNQYSLPVQVFRSSNGVWLETTETDNLTLHEQNEMGREASERTAHVEVGYYED